MIPDANEPVRISLDVSPEHLETVIGRLADMVVNKQVTMVWEVQDGSTSQLLPEYTPGRITWFTDPDTAEPKPVVTLVNMLDFAHELDIAEGGDANQAIALRLFNQLDRHTTYGVMPYIYRVNDKMYGFHADKLSELATSLQTNQMKILNIGAKGVDFLSTYCQGLLVRSTDAATP